MASSTAVGKARPIAVAAGFSSASDPDPRAFNHGKKIGILIVAYNAVTTLKKVLNRIPKQAWENVAEVAILDDASQDATYELALGYKSLNELGDKLHVVRHPENKGYGGNQKAGYQYFIEKGFDVVVLLHGDGQYAPEIISHLYHPIVTGQADAVFGSRMMKDYGGPLQGGMPLYKYLGNRILTAMENRALGLHLTEFHSGYRAYNLHALKQIDMTHMTDDFHFDTEIIIKLHHQGFRIREVPIPTYYGDEICYVNGLKYAKDVTRSVIRYKRTVRSIRKYPEFAEYWTHYPLKESRYSSHDIVRRWVGSKQRVLDVGCGDGYFAAQIRQLGNTVSGVDLVQTPAQREAFDEYVSADLSQGLEAAISRLSQQKFDKILLMDILEHLPDPERIVRECRNLLTPQGQILISVPNVANITVRLALLLGRFEYADRGILDRTHLRFFTRKSARRMIEQCGFQIVRETVTVMPLELVLGANPSNPVLRAMTEFLYFATLLLPGLLGYQCVFAVRPK
ncbi:MAG: bifunctional glycosyltransferase/class I SAM-dependent methyltransferase [Bryobacteraceae bacterium]|nr:bifunctional glycosyltransferase/class I SAM-dependent methyltransferase [Bryobacteraceae bacterium]MDW8378118.1 bifunctional glycosyltransferase/class I SAM-dependent methyltransferase [Bryobacterales bacterium]